MATDKKPRKKPTTDYDHSPIGDLAHARGLQRMGRMIHHASAGQQAQATGYMINQALESGVKAILPGRQSDRQIQEHMVKFRQAFVRQLAEVTLFEEPTSDSGKV